MEKFSELIKIRRSMRKFTAEKLTEEQLKTILRAALMSPSSKGTHCWQFVVVQDEETLAQLSHCKAQGAEFLSGAPCGVVVSLSTLVSTKGGSKMGMSDTEIRFSPEVTVCV